MLQKPTALTDEKLIACLRDCYSLQIERVEFLPIGNDPNAWVFEVSAESGVSYFLKVKRGPLSKSNKVSLLVPRALIERGITQVVTPLPALNNALWCTLDDFCVVLYPFIRGSDAKRNGMTDRQWVQFGETLRAIHDSGLDEALADDIPRETFTLPSSVLVRELLTLTQTTSFADPLAQELAEFWRESAHLIGRAVGRAQELGKLLQRKPFEHVLCHADVHAANILVEAGGDIWITDWDGPLIAPRERDLLFVVGSVIAHRVEPREEELFFRGYGSTDVDLAALAYYRYERAIEDLGENGRSVFLTQDANDADKRQAIAYSLATFEPGNVLSLAVEADRQASTLLP